MLQNASGVDRILRIGVGVAVIALAVVGPKTPWGWLGLIPLVTGALGYCPLYSLLGVRSKRDAKTTT